MAGGVLVGRVLTRPPAHPPWGQPYPQGLNQQPQQVPWGGPPPPGGGHTAGSVTPSGRPAAYLRPTSEESEAQEALGGPRAAIPEPQGQLQ